MASTLCEISEWFDRGVRERKDYMLVVGDNDDDYPVYVYTVEYTSRLNEVNTHTLQKVREVYDLHANKRLQMAERCGWHPPGAIQDDLGTEATVDGYSV